MVVRITYFSATKQVGALSFKHHANEDGPGVHTPPYNAPLYNK